MRLSCLAPSRCTLTVPSSRTVRQQQLHCSRLIVRAQPARSHKGTKQRLADQPNWSDGMATIQALMGRVQEQLQTHSNLRFNNPALAQELKTKAERHLELLMGLAESQQEQHIQGNSSSGNKTDLQLVLRELTIQLDLEQQAMLTASIDAPTPDSPSTSSSDTTRAYQSFSSQPTDNSSTSDRNDTADALRQQVQQAEAAAATLQEEVSAAKAQVSSLQQQLAESEAALQSAHEELSEHRELQMTYDKQCQDLYRLRMQLQLVRTQGNDAVSLAAQANKQHKQDLSWLMDAHRREVNDAHKKNQELIHEVQQMRLKLLEQDQLVWSLGGSTGQQQQQPQAAYQQEQSEAQQQALQQQQEAQVQLQQLQEFAEQLAVEKQQLMRSLQDSQREQAVLLMELQNLRGAAAAAAEAAAVAAAESSRDSEVTALAEAAAAAEQALKVQLQETRQHRDSLVAQVQDLQAAVQDAKAAAAQAAAQAAEATRAQALAAAAVVPAAAAAPGAAVGQRLDAAAAVEQLKVAKVEMATLRVQLASARRELKQASGRAAAAEAALQQQAAGFEARLAQLQSWYKKQAAVVAQLRRGKAPKDGQVGFTNTNKFWVRQELLFEFLKHWVSREAQLQQQEGFLGLQVQPGAAVPSDGGVDVVVSSLWESIPAWEAWSKSATGTQQHMPTGVYQYVPVKGEGFPEAFVPFRDYDAAVNAKY